MAAARVRSSAGPSSAPPPAGQPPPHDYSDLLRPLLPIVPVVLVYLLVAVYLRNKCALGPAPSRNTCCARHGRHSSPSRMLTPRAHCSCASSHHSRRGSKPVNSGCRVDAPASKPAALGYRSVSRNRPDAGFGNYHFRHRRDAHQQNITHAHDSQHRDQQSPARPATHVVSIAVRAFLPIDNDWRRLRCAELGIPPPRQKAIRAEPVREPNYLGPPHEIDKIRGDGNCLFRAVSKEVSLSEEHYGVFRKGAVRVMRHKFLKPAFESKFGMAVEGYIKKSGMHKDGVWGTELELYALATLLKTQIAVFYRPGKSRKFDWFFYPPVLVEFPDTTSPAIYLYNKGNHFDRVLTVGPLPEDELLALQRQFASRRHPQVRQHDGEEPDATRNRHHHHNNVEHHGGRQHSEDDHEHSMDKY